MSVQVVKADWSSEKDKISQIRRKVFIEEQSVPEVLEWDELDQLATHCLANSDDKYVGTGRLLSSGQIGRMSVLAPYRNKGIGEKILNFLIAEHWKVSGKPVFIHAQTQAIPFYEKAGFVRMGEEYNEAGIPHYTMILNP